MTMTPDAIPPAVRARDLVGYGRNPPGIAWPGGARVVVNLVLVYEAGSEYSVAWGDDRNDGWGEYADPGVQSEVMPTPKLYFWRIASSVIASHRRSGVVLM